MEHFCKGLLWGALIGTCVGAIVVAKNKKLSHKLREGLEVTEDKIKETKQILEDKLCQDDLDCYECDEKSNNNNFSKKNKNC